MCARRPSRSTARDINAASEVASTNLCVASPRAAVPFGGVTPHTITFCTHQPQVHEGKLVITINGENE